MLALLDLCRAVDQIFDAGPVKIALKDFIRIVEIADDKIKTRKIICQLWRQLGTLRKKTGEWSVFDRTNGLCVEPIFRKHSDMFVAENLNVCARIGVTQCLERGQGENEIADRPAADDQNAFHVVL